MKQLFKKIVGQNLKKEQVIQFQMHFLNVKIIELLKSEKVNDSFHEPIVECASSRTEDIQKALINTASHITQAHLKDFDWKLQVLLPLLLTHCQAFCL